MRYEYAKRKAMRVAKEFARECLVVTGRFVRNSHYRGNEWIARDVREDAVVTLEQIAPNDPDEQKGNHLRIIIGDWGFVARVFAASQQGEKA